MQRHQSVITGGLVFISIALISFYVASERTGQADISQALQSAPVLSVAETSSSQVTMVTRMVTPAASPWSPVVTPQVTPVSPSVSPSPTPRVTMVSPSATPSRTPVPTTPVPTLLPTATPTPPSATVRVVINEIAWMGTEADFNDEWIELYNPGNEAVDLAGWRLISQDNKPDIVLSGSILPGGYYLIGRSPNQPVSDTPADLVISFGGGAGAGLSNTCETLELRDSSGNPVDMVTCGAGSWFAGTSSPRASMERVSALQPGTDAGNWKTNTGSIRNGTDADGGPILGTPRAKNESSQ